MRLSSPVIGEGERIDRRYSARGRNELPPLCVADVPPGTRSLAIVVEDPDSPLGDVTHWLAWNIPPQTRQLDAVHLPQGCRLGTNSFGKVGYRGPTPPEGRHRIRFVLLALDMAPSLPRGANRGAFEHAVSGHVLARAELTGFMDASEAGTDGASP
ncbi:YbhB/YbcL family Raf kinase inhibitor-like protein [Ectothiorhodospiraceae bacterium WFHF3C12]|nr:YbhB/YbcL family Raf kinase inhibitor-like protein [Ectothiorhodospiraceae bacterium WFHF3C12]